MACGPVWSASPARSPAPAAAPPSPAPAPDPLSVRAVLQRVSSASVTVDGEVTGAIERGILVLLGVGPDDTEREVQWMVNKLAGLRVFPDEDYI